MRRRQRQAHEGRRRYHDIFEGTGVALCVLDLSSLPGFLEREQLHTRALKQWLHNNPEQRQHLCELRITEVNQVALHCWTWLVRRRLGKTDQRLPEHQLGHQLSVLEAVLNQQQQLELEITLSRRQGATTSIYGWCCACREDRRTIRR
jgi:hypothetical protein